MIKDEINAVEAFHLAFGLGIATQPTATLAKETIDLRFNLMKEENEEYLEAAAAGDLVEIADALGDMLYILCVGPSSPTAYRIRLQRFLTKSSEVI